MLRFGHLSILTKVISDIKELKEIKYYEYFDVCIIWLIN